MKKIIYILLFALMPVISQAAFPASWQATSTTQGSISPVRINGTDQAVMATYFMATSTSATSTFANGINLTKGCFSINTLCLTQNSGTVTSVAMTVPTGLSVSGSPITNSGTFGLTLTAGYNIPLTASTTQWNNLYQSSTTLPYVTSVNITVPTGLSISGCPVTSSGTCAISLGAGYVIPLTASTTQWNALVAASTSLPYVTSVGLTVPTGLSVSNSPITSSGNIGLSLQSGYNIPLNASTTNWNNFFNTPSSQITAGTNLSWSGNTLNASGGGGGSGMVGTSTVPTVGQLAYWTSNGTPSLLGSEATSAPSLGLGLTYTGNLGYFASGTSGTLNIATSSLYTGSTGQVAYFNGTNAISGNSAVFISASNNVGINNTSPTQALDVGGFINTDQFSGYKQAGSLLGYASSTNQATIWGIIAGGNNATTSATIGETTAIGYSALNALTTGTSNTAVGDFAGKFLTTGIGNVALGSNALRGFSAGSPLTGTGNIAIGTSSLLQVTGAASSNIGIGGYALASIGSGSNNIQIGANPAIGGGILSGSAASNILIGNGVTAPTAAGSNQLNIGNTIFGSNIYSTQSTVSSAPVANSSIGIGTSTAIAKFAIQGNSSDTYANLFLIASSTPTATTTLLNLTNAGQLNVNGFINTDQFSGYKQNGTTILYASSTNRSMAVGVSAGGTSFQNFSTPVDDTFVGNNSGRGLATTNAGGNTGLGSAALSVSSNLTGAANTAIGVSTLAANNTGQYNTALGASGCTINAAGSGNLCLGANAGTKINSSSNFVLNASTTAYSTLALEKTNSMMFGTFANNGNAQALAINALTGIGTTTSIAKLAVQSVATDATQYLFDVATTSGAAVFDVTSNGNVGIGTSSPSQVLSLVGGIYASSTATSTFLGGGINLITAAGNIPCYAVNGTCITQNAGTVTSVAATVPSIFSISGSPITGAGTLAMTYSGTALPVANGGTGQTTFGQGWLSSDGTTITSSTSPTVNYITATSTTATSTFGYGINLQGGCFAIATVCIGGGSGTNYFTNTGNDTLLTTGTFLDVPATGGYNIGASLLGYASSTNQATIWGLGAGGNNATTSATVKGATALGYHALTSLSTGNGNTAVGWNSLSLDTTAPNNTAVGFGALWGTGAFGATGNNTAIGYEAAASTTSGNNNTFVGSNAGTFVSSGSQNVAIGVTSLYGLSAAITGSDNVAIGNSSMLQLNGAAAANIGLGFNSLSALGTGSNNIQIGAYNSSGGINGSASSNIMIGNGVQTPSVSGSNQLNIGNAIYGLNMYGNLNTISSAPNANASIGIGTSTAISKFAISLNSNDTLGNAFLVSSSTASATTTLFGITNTGHIFGTSTNPVLSSCGTSPTIVGSDSHGTITVGSVSATGCTMTFSTPYATAPSCVISNRSMSVVNALTYTVTTSALTLTQTGLTGDLIDYICMQN